VKMTPVGAPVVHPPVCLTSRAVCLLDSLPISGSELCRGAVNPKNVEYVMCFSVSQPVGCGP